MICPQCQTNVALQDRELGVLPCKSCQLEDEKIPRPTQSRTYDFASSTTRLQRKTHGHEMFQPFVDGALSREYVEAYGTDKLSGITEKDVKNAKYVYGGMTRHHKMVEKGKQVKRQGQPKDYYKVVEGERDG